MDVAQDVAAGLEAVKADVEMIDARVGALEMAAGGVMRAVKDKAVAAQATLVAGATKVEAVAEADFKVIWGHKAIVLFDVVLLIAAWATGHYG